MQFGDIERFLIEAEATNVGPQLLPQLQAIFSFGDPERLINLKLELTITIDVGEHFLKATYFLECDGPLEGVFSLWDRDKKEIHLFIPQSSNFNVTIKLTA